MRSRLTTVGLLLVLVLAAFLRLAGGPDNPGWFSDEGTHLAIAQQMLAGRGQYLAVGDSTLLFARLPLFPGLLALLLAAAGAGPAGDPARGMAVLRALTGSLGALTTLLLYLAARRLTAGGAGPYARRLPLLAALIYALYSPAIIYSRLGFSYNLLAPLALLVLWGAGAALQPSLHTSTLSRPHTHAPTHPQTALALGLATLVDLWAWVLLPPLLIVTGWQAWQARRGRRPVRAALRAMALAAGLAAAPFGVYALVQALSEPAAFAFDLRFTLGRLSALSLPAQAANVLGSLATLMTQDGWLALGLVGLFTLRPARLAGLALLFTFVPLLLLGRTTALYSLSYYYLIPLLPLAALGAAAVILALTRALTHALTHSLTHALTLFLALLAVGALGQNFSQLRAGFSTAIDPFLLAPADARAAAEYVAARRAPGELVLASPGLAWLLPGETADFEQSLAYTGVDTPHVPGDLPRERYRFSPAPRRARFVIVDNLWRNWGVFNVAGLPALLAEVERWPVVFQAGEIAVYEQPATGE